MPIRETNEAEEQESETDLEDRQIEVDELARANTNRIYRLRLSSIERWYPTPRPTEEGELFYIALQQKFGLAYEAARMQIFPHRVLAPSRLT